MKIFFDTLQQIPHIACPGDAPPGVLGFIPARNAQGEDGWTIAELVSVEPMEAGGRQRCMVCVLDDFGRPTHPHRRVSCNQFRVQLVRATA